MWQGSIPWSSMFHEMGHDMTLNSPSNYFYGGKIDGNANAIFSESMAQIFQHATAYELINSTGTYGLGNDIVFEIKQSAIQSMWLVRSSYEDYVSSGMKFSSWNDPATPVDETFGTFMTIAYRFFVHAENSGLGYQIPLEKMTNLLQKFGEIDRERYSQNNNTPTAETFRATLMVAALSYGFGEDLRTEFRNLKFPISDETYNELIQRASARAISSLSVGSSSGSISLGASVTLSGTITPAQPSPGIPSGTTVVLSYGLEGGSRSIFNMTQTASGGAYSVAWYPPYPGSYLIRASWDGNPNYEGATSSMLSLNVTGVVPPRVTLVLSGPSSASRGDAAAFEILVDNGGSALSATLYLEIVGPGGYRYRDFQQIVVGEGRKGRYQFNWQIPSGVSVGQYDVSVGLIPPKPTAATQTVIAIV